MFSRKPTMCPDYLDPFIETLGREALGQIQLKKLQLMLDSVIATNALYGKKLKAVGIESPEDIRSFADYRKVGFTTKKELSADQLEHPPYGSNLTFPVGNYTRIHQTSGTTGEPLRCLDTEESWNWWTRCWATVYKATGVTSSDRIFFAFSFGPFIGFWSAHDGARHMGAMSIPGGGMSSHQRLQAILIHDVSVLVCTPTYALHLAEVAEDDGIDIADSNVRLTLHAGEPGASLPATKDRIQTAWGAQCRDHAGATEVGAWGFECQEQAGLHMNEGEFICEVIDPETGEPTDEGELVITNLGRIGMPVIRYRTGDRVKIDTSPCACGRTFYRLAGGVTGRVDDVMIVRGVNVVPSALENIIRAFSAVGEFAVDVFRRHELDELDVRIEVNSGDPEEVASDVSKKMRDAIGIRANVEAVPHGSLPRFDLKAKRFTDRRQTN
jgi:phenylacetate-CoA ligase